MKPSVLSRWVGVVQWAEALEEDDGALQSWAFCSLASRSSCSTNLLGLQLTASPMALARPEEVRPLPHLLSQGCPASLTSWTPGDLLCYLAMVVFLLGHS